MATYSPIESPSPRPTARSPFAPVFLWLVIQLIALAIPIARVPFFATKHFPHTPETLASGVMLVFQIGSSALLFPFLLRDAKTATMAVAASWPFTVLAGFLTAQPDQRTLPAACKGVQAKR